MPACWQPGPMRSERTDAPVLPVLSDGIVTLRAPAIGDIDAITEACQDPSVTRYTSIPAPYERAHAEVFVRESAQHWVDRLSANFVITASHSGELLGCCGIIRLDDPDGVVEVGYWLKVGARGRGYVTRAVLRPARAPGRRPQRRVATRRRTFGLPP
jgi:RimJ/RimL family protein N-acetyltransferase